MTQLTPGSLAPRRGRRAGALLCRGAALRCARLRARDLPACCRRHRLHRPCPRPLPALCPRRRAARRRRRRRETRPARRFHHRRLPQPDVLLAGRGAWQGRQARRRRKTAAGARHKTVRERPARRRDAGARRCPEKLGRDPVQRRGDRRLPARRRLPVKSVPHRAEPRHAHRRARASSGGAPLEQGLAGSRPRRWRQGLCASLPRLREKIRPENRRRKTLDLRPAGARPLRFHHRGRRPHVCAQC